MATVIFWEKPGCAGNDAGSQAAAERVFPKHFLGQAVRFVNLFERGRHHKAFQGAETEDHDCMGQRLDLALAAVKGRVGDLQDSSGNGGVGRHYLGQLFRGGAFAFD